MFDAGWIGAQGAIGSSIAPVAADHHAVVTPSSCPEMRP
jgi:hypothetical protein